MKKCTKLFAVVFVAALVLVGGTAYAKYPEQPITLICPWAAGGGTDAVARIVATLMQQDLGVPVNVVNRTGGNGVVGHQAILSAKPDGYTIGLGTAELGMLHWTGLTKFTAADFNPIGCVNMDAAAITVAADSWKDYDALMADIKASKGKLTASGTAVGGIWHLAMEAWIVGAGLPVDQVRWIPTEGANPAQQELLAGGVNMVTCSLPEVVALVDAGKEKVLAYMGDARAPKYPDVPTLKELGVPVTVGTWRGVVAPKGIPADITDVLVASLKKAVDSKEFIEFMGTKNYGIKYMPAKEWGEFMIAADEQFGSVMKAAGLSK